MEYKVLYRKYRPTNFDELIGQDSIVRILRNSMVNDKLAHAYIFTGPRGTGKTSTAKIFAKALNCPNSKDGIPCDKCENCLNFNTSPDIIELDAASNNGVDYIREIKDNVLIAPSYSKYKVYIIDEVHMLSNAAWNAFLKTLEEPPQDVIFILATTEIQKVPITVLSRCQRFDFNRIDRGLIQKHLIDICKKEKIKYKEDAITEISYLSDGCMRDALSILDQLSKVSDEINMDILKQNYGTVTDEDINQIYIDILHNDLDLLIEHLNNVKETGVDIKLFINKMIENFINKAVDMKKKNVSNTSFNHIKEIIKILNELLININSITNGYLLLQLNLLSFINSDDNQMSTREIEQIISSEIISSSSKVELDNMINENKAYYDVCDKFIDIRINNAFTGASKELKKEFLDKWNDFIKQIKKDDLKELIHITRDAEPMVVSYTNVLFVVDRESAKMVANNKLDVLENSFNSKEDKYKMIFITRSEWDNYMKNYDKTKIYKYIDDSEYINEELSQSLAKDLFGDDVNIE